MKTAAGVEYDLPEPARFGAAPAGAAWLMAYADPENTATITTTTIRASMSLVTKRMEPARPA